MPYAESEKARIYYEVYGEVHGDGPPLVLAHGAGGNRISWWRQVPHFARQHRVVVFDHRGFGRSRCEEFHPKHFARDLEAVLAAEDIDRCAIVCQSMGGWTGLPFALRHPDRVAALVLGCTPGGCVTDAVLAAAAATGARIEAAGIDHTPALGAEFAKRRPDLVHLYDQIGRLNTEVELAAVALLFDPASRLDPDAIAALRTPTLMLTGSDDLLFPAEMMHAVAAGLPGAEIREIAGAGHSIYFEKPDTFNRIVREFLALHP